MDSRLLDRIADRSASLAVLGMGSVGLPLARAFVRAGFTVLGFDVDAGRVEQLSRGESYLSHFADDLVGELAASGRFQATCDPERLAQADIKIICVPTPLGEYREPDLSYIESASRLVAATLSAGQMVVLESTTYPSTTRGVVLPILEEGSGLSVGKDVLLAYSPEREDPGRSDYETATTTKLVGGLDERSGEAAEALYDAAVESVRRVPSAEVAESAKLLENIFRAVNIALVNELKVVLQEMDIDVWDVIDAAASKPFGFMKFTPGPGMGGHCIPIDPFYLTWIARKVGLSTKFIELAGEINRQMPKYVVERTQQALNERGKAIKGAKILVLGLAYKPDVNVATESPAIPLIESFAKLGGDVSYSDPYIETPPADAAPELAPLGLRSVPLDAGTVAAQDVVVVATNHSTFDWDLVAKHAQLVVDTRNALAEKMAGNRDYVKA